MQIIKYLQLPFTFDVKRLQQEVEQLSGNAWKLHYQTLHYEGEWSAIPLRSIGGKADSIMIAPEKTADYQDTVFLKDALYLKEILSTFECPLQAVRLLKLNAGAVIKEHTDAELNFEKGEVRFHIPVITSEQVGFYLDGERIFLKEGECWYMNFNLPHYITNNSNINRIHLVVDAVVNDWVKELFDQDDLPAKSIIKEKERYDAKTKLQIIARFREMNTPVSNEMADKMEREMN